MKVPEGHFFPTTGTVAKRPSVSWLSSSQKSGKEGTGSGSRIAPRCATRYILPIKIPAHPAKFLPRCTLTPWDWPLPNPLLAKYAACCPLGNRQWQARRNSANRAEAAKSLQSARRFLAVGAICMGADRTQICSNKTTQQEKRVNAKCVFITKKKRGTWGVILKKVGSVTSW